MPVLTGIGHERDNTVLDEVANIRFDTPSKVIAGIESVIARRASEAKANFEGIVRIATHAAQNTRKKVEQAEALVRTSAQRQLSTARKRSTAMMSTVRVGALKSVRDASEVTQQCYLQLRHDAAGQLASARQAVPALLAEIRSAARQSLRTARSDSRSHLGAVLERAARDAGKSREAADRVFGDVVTNARRTVAEAGTRSQALMREIAGQGPEKSLGRGFAIVRAGGSTLTSARAVPSGATIEIQFRDGTLAARTHDKQESEPT